MSTPLVRNTVALLIDLLIALALLMAGLVLLATLGGWGSVEASILTAGCVVFVLLRAARRR